MHNNKFLLSLVLLSTTIWCSAQVVIISTNSNWKYKDDGSNQGTAWYGMAFNDASWPSGPAELGYGDSDEATIVNACGTSTPLPSCTNKYATTYFRQTFNVANPSAYTSYSVQMRRDDGVVLYLNGVEIYRENMPSGVISYTTFAPAACADDGALVLNPAIPSSLIVTGTNVIAAEIHQNAGSSPDLTFILTLYGNTSSVPNQFSGGNIVALVAGNGSSAISNSATPFYLKEFSPNGDMLYNYAVPITSNSLTVSGSATSEGGLTLSVDNSKLVIVGYNAPAGTATIAATAASSVNRVVAAVNATGGITYTASAGYFNTNNIRCGASDGTGNFWTCGGNTGVCYMGTASAAAITESAITSVRYLQIVNNELYFCAGSTAGIYKLGSGLPVTAGQTNSMIINTSTVGSGASPYAFFFDPQFTTCYIADDRSLANGGGIQKWVNSSGTWTLAYTLSTSIAMSTSGARGVIADFSGSYPVVYGTSAETNNNRLFRIIDGGSVSGSTVTTLATASNNTIFRGLAFSPTLSGCSAVSISSVTPGATVCNTQSLGLNVSVSGTSPFTYTWSGPGTLNSYSVSNPSLTTPVAGNYNISVSNGCGTASAIISVSVNAGPAITLSSATICAGQQATLSVNGANTYTWNGGSNSASISVSPSANTVYHVTGSDATGCTSSSTAQVVVNALPAVSVNSATECIGKSATLTAHGADSYSWSGGGTGGSVIITTTGNVVYTVTGTSAAGCVNTATSQITARPLPAISVNSETICSGSFVMLNVSGASSYTWSDASNTESIAVSPSTTTVYSVSGSSSFGCEASATATVTVNVRPTLSVNGATICEGETAYLGASGANTYTWSNSSNSSSVGVSPIVSTVYSVSGTNSLGCTGSETVPVLVNPAPALSINSSTVCSGESATLMVAGANTYTWSNLSDSSCIIVSPVSTTTYTVAGTSSTGCLAYATATVVVNITPTLSVGNVTVCSGAPAVLTASGASTYSWNTGATTPSVQVGSSVTTSYVVTGFNAGCTSSETVELLINPLPLISVNSATVCAGGSATLTANGATSYTWSDSGSGSYIVLTPSTNVNFTVSGSSVHGCTNSAVGTVSVTGVPTIAVNPSTVCAGSATVLTAAGVSTYTWSTAAVASTVFVNPAGNTVYTVSGNALDCPVVVSNTVLVTVNPLPTVGVISATVCSGHAATLTAMGASSYSWSSGGTGSTIVVSPVVSTNFTVSGTSSLLCSSSATAQLTVSPNPTVSVNNATVCPGAGAVLSASGAATYSWSTGATVGTITLNPGVTSVYTVTGTASACSDSRTTTITVNEGPTVTVGPVTICAGGTVALVAAGAATYSWSNTSTGNSIVITPTANTSFTVTGTSTAGCSNSAITTVSVTNIPSITVNSATICAGNTATLNATGVSTYTWSTNTISPGIVVSPTTSTIYTIAGTDSGCPLIVSNTVMVTVMPLPLISVNSVSLCLGASAGLLANGASTYTWNNNAFTSGITVSPVMTTIYTVTGTSALGCVGTATSQVNVIPNPTITINSPSICSGSNATLTAVGASSYSWEAGGSTSGIIVTPSVTTIYNVQGTLGGCSAPGSATVTVNPSPTLSVNSISICLGASGTLMVSGASTYSWSTTSWSTNIVVSPTANTVYSVTGVSAQGCSSSATTQVTVTSSPVLSVTSASICAGDTATVFVSGATTYTWTGGLNSPSLTVSPATTSTFPVSGNLAGCPVTATAAAAVIVNALPILTVISATVCEGSNATLVATGAITYSWSNGSTQSIAVVNPTATSFYTVTGMSSQGCSSSAIASVEVNYLPAVSLALAKAVFCVDDGGFDLAGVPAGGTFSGTGVNDNLFDPLAAGIGTVQVVYSYTDINGCSNSDNKVITINSCAGIKTGTELQTFAVWPNPASNLLFVRFDGKNDWRVEFFDLSGKMLVARKVQGGDFSLDVCDFDKGTYEIRLISGDNVITKKIVKE